MPQIPQEEEDEREIKRLTRATNTILYTDQTRMTAPTGHPVYDKTNDTLMSPQHSHGHAAATFATFATDTTAKRPGMQT